MARTDTYCLPPFIVTPWTKEFSSWNYTQQRTAPLRKETKQLLICHAEPHGPAQRDTISRWIKQTMKVAGINTTVFKAHSTRGAATSAAKASNVPVQVIMNAAGWRTDSTFARFYDRPVLAENSFGDAILGNKNCNLTALDYTFNFLPTLVWLSILSNYALYATCNTGL